MHYACLCIYACNHKKTITEDLFNHACKHEEAMAESKGQYEWRDTEVIKLHKLAKARMHNSSVALS